MDTEAPEKKGQGKRSRWRLVHILTLAILAGIFCLFFFRHIPNQTQKISERNFRLLVGMSDQTKEKIHYLVSSLTKATSKAAPLPGEKRARQMEQLTPGGAIRHKLVQSLELISPKVELHGKIIESDPKAPKLSIQAKPGVTKPWLYLSQNDGNRFTIRTDFDEFLSPIINLHGDEFDDVLIVDAKNGNVLFQSKGGVLRVTELPALASAHSGKSGDTNLVSNASSLGNIQLAGERYKLFLTPLQFSLHGMDDSYDSPNGSNVDWLFCGLVRADRFAQKAYGIHYLLITAFVFATLLFLLSWPFLNLQFIKSASPPALPDALAAMVATVLGCGVLTFGLLELCLTLGLHDVDDNALHGAAMLAERIEKNLTDELTAANEQLIEYDKLAIERMGQSSVSNSVTRILENDSLAPKIYPHLYSTFWAQANGTQLFKWTIAAETTPIIDIPDREYFWRIERNLALEGLDAANFSNPFFIQSIFSRTRGENVAIISVPSAGLSATNLSNPPVMAALETRLISLHDPVLPPGYGFCVFDKDGETLFHSDSRHNLRENFLKETETEKEIQAAVKAGTDWSGSVDYDGQPCHLFSKPLTGLPWSLAVFKNKDVLRGVSIRVLFIGTAIYAYCLFLFISLWFLFFLLTSRRLPRFLWLQPSKSRRYWCLAGANVALAGLLMLGIWEFPDFLTRLFWFSPFLAFLWSGLTLFILQAEPAPWTRTPATKSIGFLSNPYQSGYVAYFGTLITLVVMIPALFAYKLSLDHEINLFVKGAQWKMGNQLRDRETRLEARLRELGTKPDQIQENLVRRLAVTWDQYSNYIFETKVKGPSSLFEASVLSEPGRDVALDEIAMPLLRFLKNSDQDPNAAKPHIEFPDWIWTQFSTNTRIALTNLAKANDSDTLFAEWPTYFQSVTQADEDVLADALQEDLIQMLNNRELPEQSELVRGVESKNLARSYKNDGSISNLIALNSAILRHLFQISPLPKPQPLSGIMSWTRPGFLKSDVGNQGQFADNWIQSGQELRSTVPPRLPQSTEYRVPLRIQSQLPYFVNLLLTPKNFWPLAIGAVLTAATPFILVWLLARQLVLMRLRSTTMNLSIGESPLHVERQPQLASSDGVAVDALKRFASVELGRCQVTDLANEAKAKEVLAFVERWSEKDGFRGWARRIAYWFFLDRLRLRKETNTVLVLDNWDHVEGSLAELKEDFLRLLTRSHRRVVVVITKDQLDIPSSQVMTLDPSLYNPKPDAPQLENHQEIIRHLTRHYGRFWQECTSNEKVALYQVAVGGLVNARMPETRALLRKGLLTWNPAIQLFNESFRRFVLTCYDPSDAPAETDNDEIPVWQRLRGSLLFVIIGVSVFLFITQREMWNLLIGLIPVFLHGLATLSKIPASLAAYKSPDESSNR